MLYISTLDIHISAVDKISSTPRYPVVAGGCTSLQISCSQVFCVRLTNLLNCNLYLLLNSIEATFSQTFQVIEQKTIDSIYLKLNTFFLYTTQICSRYPADIH